MDVQTTFSRRHVGLLIAVLLYVGNNLLINNDGDGLKFIPCFVIAGVLAVDIFLAYFYFFHKFTLLMIVRFVELSIVGLFISNTNAVQTGDISDIFVIMFYTMFSIESLLLFDLTDGGKAIRVSLLCQIPFVIKAIAAILSDSDNPVLVAVDYCFISVISFMVIYAITFYYGKIQDYYDQCVFAKDRMLDRAKDNSDKVTDGQKSIMAINEQLGIKKFELEVAYQKINNTNADIILQNKFLKIMTSSFSLPYIIEETSKAFKTAFDLCYCGVVFKNRKLRDKYSRGIEEIIDSQALDMFYGFFLSYAFIHEHCKMGNNYILNDVDYDEMPYFADSWIQSIAVKAIENDNPDHTCIVVLLSKHKDTFKDREEFLNNIFGQMEVVSRNLSMYKQIEEMSIKDGLTGLYNRRYLNRYYHDRFIESKPAGSVSVLMLDIDHFKNINDTYGHLFGDIAINTIAGIIKEAADEFDGSAFRYGGEEFVLIFENKSFEETISVTEGLLNKIRVTDVVSEEMGLCVSIRASIGVTAYPYTTDEYTTLVDRADKAMYYSKKNGRDRITVDGQYTAAVEE